MALAEGVAARDQRHGLLVVHRHAGEGHPDVVGRPLRIAVGVGSLGVHVDERLVGGGERVLQVVVGVAVLAAPALVAVHHVVEARDRAHLDHLGAPVGGVVRLPGVEPPAAEPVGRQTHDLQGAIACQDHQVGPGQGVAVLVLDRLQEAARLVGVAVVPPAGDRREALHPGAGAAAPVGDPVGAGRVPGHADHLRAVIAVVGGPPVHRRGQELLDVALERLEVDLGELSRVVEIRPEGIGRQPVLVEHFHPQAMGIPVLQRRTVAVGAADPVAAERTLARHRERRGVRLVDRLAHQWSPRH